MSVAPTEKSMYDMKIIRKPVDQWLDEVSYTADESYVPSLFALEMVNFIKLVNGGEGEENKTPVLHLRMLDQVVSGDKNIANLVYRGSGKTTVMGEYLFLYIAVYGELPEFGEINLALYVSDSIENGVKNMRKNLEYRWENSDFLKKYLPFTRFTDVRWEFKNIAGKTLVVKGYGAKTGVRGTKEMGIRPQFALLDDLVSDEDAKSPTVIKSIENTVYKAIDYALHPKNRLVVWNGTPFNQNDPLYKAVESGAWRVNVYPVCEHFDEDTTLETFIAAWPDRHNYKYVREQYMKAKLSGNIESFYQELMLRISSEDERLVTDNDLLKFDGGMIMSNERGYNFYITTDFATSSRQTSDFSVITCWAYNSSGQWMLIDGSAERNSMDRTIDKLFDMVVKYDVKQVGIEVSGQQKGFADWTRKEMHVRNIYFTVVEVRPSIDKLSRFNAVVPYFKRGEIWINEALKNTKYYKEMMNELKYAVRSGLRSKHDDVLDTISQLPYMNPWKPAALPRSKGYEDPFYEESKEHESALASYII